MASADPLTHQALEHLPLSDAVLHILLCLADGPAHGYAILQEVEARSDGAVRMGTGTLYSAVKRLREAGIIEEQPAPGDARRRNYALTPLGRAVLRAETGRLESLLRIARRKAVWGGGGE
jgi:DNA-binding PadR family transcriptional regulator